MSSFDIALAAIPVLILLIFLRFPIAAAMLALGFGGIWMINGTPGMAMSQLKHLTYGTLSNYSFTIVPLFLLMGQFAAKGGLSAALFRAAQSLIGHWRGGMAMAAIGACAGFGAICGSSLATAGTMGRVALPELKSAGYAGGIATATLAAGGTLGILIPPSVILVIYAIIAEQNIAKLFAAAFIPGLLAMFGYALVIAVYARLRPRDMGHSPRADWVTRRRDLRAIWPVVLIFALVVGGIYGGVFTPTEAAAVGAAGTGLLAVFQGGMRLRGLKEALTETLTTAAMIYAIIIGAALFNSFLALSGLPQSLSRLVSEQGFGPMTVLWAVLLMYLIMGCFMDSLSMILLSVPILFPILNGMDFGLSGDEFGIWFGILVLVVVEVGLITPPVGMNLFVINALDRDVPLGATFRATMPFVASDILRVVILVAFPPVTLAGIWIGNWIAGAPF